LKLSRKATHSKRAQKLKKPETVHALLNLLYQNNSCVPNRCTLTSQRALLNPEQFLVNHVRNNKGTPWPAAENFKDALNNLGSFWIKLVPKLYVEIWAFSTFLCFVHQ